MHQMPIHVEKLAKSWREYGHEVQKDIENGGRFIKCSYTVSFIAITISKDDVYYVPSECSKLGKAGIRNIVSLALGWWGFPWGPIKTIQSLTTNSGGGKDVTVEYARKFKLQTRGQVAREKHKQRLRSEQKSV